MKALGCCLGLLALAWVGGASAAEEATAVGRRSAALSGQRVSEVRFEGVDRKTADDLAQLVSLQEGEPWDPQRVRRALELMHRLGQFDAIEAEAEPAGGGLALVFRLSPSPRICAVQVVGSRAFPPAQLRAVLRKGPQDPYVPGDEVRLAEDLVRHYLDMGFFDVKVEGRVGDCALRPGRRLRLTVSEGEPYPIVAVTLPSGAALGFSEEKVRRLLGPALRPGRRYRREAVLKGLRRMRQAYLDQGFVELNLLAELPTTAGLLPAGARVESGDGGQPRGITLNLAFDAGPWVRPTFTFYPPSSRRPPWRAQKLRSVIGLSEARRATEAYTDDAARQLERFLRERGHLNARVDSAPTRGQPRLPTADLPRHQETVLDFRITPGPEYIWTARDFELLLEGRTDPREARRVLKVLSEASPTVLGHRPAFWSVVGLNVRRRYYTADAMESALGTLRDYYRARGYLGAEATHAISRGTGRRRRRLGVQVEVARGVRTSVEGMLVELGEGLRSEPEGRGASRAEGWEELAADWKRQLIGRPFNPSDLERIGGEASRFLADAGHVDAEVRVAYELSDDKALARLTLRAEPRDAVTVGQVLVRDHRHTGVGLIRREAGIESGELFRPALLAKAQNRLLRTGLFDGALARLDEGSGRVRDVRISVQERKRLFLAGGVGLTWPDDGPRVSGELRLRNLDGRGLSFVARGRANVDWRFLQPGITPMPEYRASVGLELPIFAGEPLGAFRLAVTGVLGDELDEPTFRVRRSSLAAAVTSRGLDRVTVGAGVELQGRAPLRVDPAARLSSTYDQPTDKPFADARALLLASLNLSFDGRNSPLNPVYGVYAAITADTTFGNFPSDQPGFGQATTRLVGLVPFGLHSGFGLRLEASGGIAWSYEAGELPPIEYRFRAGGSASVRGYRLDSLGPSGQRSGLLATEGLLLGQHGLRTVTVGGTVTYRYAVELLVPLGFGSPWKVAVFHDAGDALLPWGAPEGADDGSSPAWHASVGLGVRRSTPIGPLRLDLAVRPDGLAALNDTPLGDVLRLHFAIGSL